MIKLTEYGPNTRVVDDYISRLSRSWVIRKPRPHREPWSIFEAVEEVGRLAKQSGLEEAVGQARYDAGTARVPGYSPFWAELHMMTGRTLPWAVYAELLVVRHLASDVVIETLTGHLNRHVRLAIE